MTARIGLDARMAGPVPTGLGTYAVQLARALARLDAEHSYVIIRRSGGPSPMAVGPNVSEVVLDGELDALPNLARGRAIARLRLDLYHSLHHFLPLALDVPRVVVTLHDLIWIEHGALIRGGAFAPVTRPATRLFARGAMGYAVRRADAIIAVSAHSRARALAYYGLDPRRVSVVHHGVDSAAFAPGPPDTCARPFFLCLGNSRPYKDLPTALRAFAACATEDAGVTLVVTGRGDSTRDLRRLARRLGIGARVTFTGPMRASDLLQLLRGASALVFPSLVEGFGLPVLEAMAAGCPVIASSCPTVVEIAGGAAIICETGNTDAFAAAMRRVLAEPALRERLRASGVARAKAFTWERCAAETLAVYRTLLAAG